VNGEAAPLLRVMALHALAYCELEMRFLEKEWTGEPGLFARARLR
jgi:hypothetical protein